MSTPTVIQSCAALYGIVPGAAGVTFVNGQIGTGKAFATEDAMLNHYYEATFTVWAPKTTAQVAGLIVANLGLTGATATSEAARIAGLLDGVAMNVRGAKVKEIVTAFEATPAAATFNAAKAALVTAVADPTYQGIPGKGVGELVFASLSTAQIQLGTSEAINTVLLTTGVDTVPGSTGTEVITGTVSNLAGTLQATDVIDGAGGTDRLNLTLDVDFTGFTSGSLKNVETVGLTNAGATARAFNATGSSGVKTFALDGTTGGLSLTALPTGVEAISLKGQTAAFSSAYVAGATEISSTTTALKLNLDSVGTSTTRVNLTAEDVNTLNINATGANFVSVLGTDATAVAVTGAGTLNTTVVAASAVTSFDGSAATGALTVNLTGVTTANAITSVKTGSGADSITLERGDLKLNATIAGGDGADTLNISRVSTDTGDSTVAYVLSGVETVALGSIDASSNLTFAASAWTGIETVSVLGTTSGVESTVSFAGLGAKNITANILDGTVSTGVLSADNSGSATLNFKANSTAGKAGTAADKSEGNVTFTEASSLTVNLEAFTHFDDTGTDGVISASKATSVTLNVASGLDSTGAELTAFEGELDAPKATSFTVNATGRLGVTGDPAIIDAPLATAGTITNGVTAGLVTLTDASKLKSLTLTSGNTLDVTSTATYTALQNLTINANKGLVTLTNNDDFAKANTVTITGSGSGSGVVIDNLGSVTNAYDLTVKASGTLKGSSSAEGVELGEIAITKGNNVSLDFSGVTGAVTIGKIGGIASDWTTADTTNIAGNVTISAAGVGTASGVLATGLVVGNIVASGAVNINAKGAKTVDLADVTAGSIVIDQSGTEGTADNLGTLTAKTSVNLSLNSLATNDAIAIVAASDATSFAVTVNGGVLVDTVTVTGTGTSLESINVSGSLDASTDSIVVNGNSSKAKSISIAALASYDAATIEGGSGKDTIVGGAGADYIIARGGANVLTGGAGTDVFSFDKGDSPYTAINEITDLSSSDRVQYGTSATLTRVAESTTAAGSNTLATTGGIADAGGTFTVNANGVFAFSATTSSGIDSIAKKVGILASQVSTDSFGYFAHDGVNYLYIDGGTTAADATVVKLTGISLPSDVPTFDNADAAGSPTGITGVGA